MPNDRTDTTPNHWRETVRAIYDRLHFGEDNLFVGSHLARRILNFIEDRHPDYFRNGKTLAEWQKEDHANGQ